MNGLILSESVNSIQINSLIAKCITSSGDLKASQDLCELDSSASNEVTDCLKTYIKNNSFHFLMSGYLPWMKGCCDVVDHEIKAHLKSYGVIIQKNIINDRTLITLLFLFKHRKE